MKTFWGKILTLKGIHSIKTEMLANSCIDEFCLKLRQTTGLSPNQITVFNLGLGLVSWLVLFENTWLFSLLMLIHIVLDGFDGHYARITGTVSARGERLDHWGDFGIGVLMLLKSYWYFGYWWILWLIIAFVAEMIIIQYKGWNKDKFPTRMFLNIYMLGLYELGLIVQLLFQPITWLAFGLGKRKKKIDL